MHLRSIRYAFALIPIALVGCGKSAPPHPAGPYVPPNQAARESFERELPRASVTCEDPADCPKNVGLVVIVMNAKDLGQCSGTLVGPDVVAMNSHCVPDIVKQYPTLCKDQLGFVLANAPHERAACSELLIASKIRENDSSDPDYALMRLSRKLTDEPTEISTQGVEDVQELTLYTTDPISQSGIAGRVRKKICTAVQGSFLASEYTHSLAPIVSVVGDGCRIIPGNSGSGMLDAQGKLVGVISHGPKKDTAQPPIMGVTPPRYFGLGANFACADLRSISIPQNGSCPAPGAQRPGLMERAITASTISSAIERAATEMTLRSSPVFKFRVTLDEKRIPSTASELDLRHYLAKLDPVCVKPVADWIGQITTVPRPLPGGGQAVAFLTSHENHLLRLVLGVDDWLRPILNEHRAHDSTVDSEILLQGSTQTQFNGTRTLTYPASPGTQPRRLAQPDLSLTLCTEQELQQPYELVVN